MATKKAATSGAEKRGRGRPKSADPKPTLPVVMTIRAREDWEAWIDAAGEELVRRTGLAIRLERTAVVDAALAELAKVLELPPPPARF
jgi:hypothetical protein